MTLIPYMRLSLLALIALPLACLGNSEENHIKGQTYQLEKNKSHSIDFLSRECRDVLQARLLPPCPPPPPPAPSGIVPTQNPAALPGSFFPNPAASNPLVAVPQTVGTVFVAGDQSTNPSFVGTPPGAMASVGPSQIITALNVGVTSFTRAGTRDNVLDVQPSSFVNLDGDLNSIANIFDTQIYFDRDTNRWFYAGLNYDGLGNIVNGGFTIAVSDGPIITNATAWTVVHIYNSTIVPDSNGCAGDQNTFFDFLSMGVDRNAVYLGFSIFDVDSNYLSTSAFVIQKSSLLNPGPAFITVFRDVVGFVGSEYPYRISSARLTAPYNFDANPQFGYFISTDPLLYGLLNIYRVVNPGSTSPTLSPLIDLNVPATSSSALAQVPFAGNLFGSLGTLELSDDRIHSPVIRNGQLYAAQVIKVNSAGAVVLNPADVNARSAIRWYQINLSGGGTETATTQPTLVQAGTLFDNAVTNPLWYNMPSLMVNQRGDLVIGFTVSSNLFSANAGFVGRLAGDPLGILRIGTVPPNIYAAGGGQYSRMLGDGGFETPPGGQRWGSYSSTSLDPLDNMTMWTIQERAINSLEQVVVAQLLAP